jgi:hypothetical protein
VCVLARAHTSRMTCLRRHANGVNAFAVYLGGTWTATDAAGGFRVVCDSLEQAEAEADERVAMTFPHDCAQCPAWEHPEPDAH